MSSRRISRFAIVALVLLGMESLVSNRVLHAQVPEAYPPAAPSYVRYGLFGGVTVNNHLLYFNDFAVYQSSLSPLQRGFVNANYGVISYYVGGLIEYPLIERLGVSLRGSVTDIQSLSLVASENFLLAPSGTTTPSAIQINHAVTFNNLQMLSGEPYLTYRLEGGLTLYAGARFGFMVNPTYSYKQTVTDDSPIKFVLPNGQTTGVWNAITNSPIPQANPINTALSFGASLETLIDPQGHWFVAVEAFYMHGLTPVTNSLVLPRPIANYNGLPATRFVPANELGGQQNPLSQAWPSELDAGSWLLNNIRAGISLHYAP